VSLLILFNSAARRSLFAAARGLLDDGHNGPAVAVAQTAVEVAFESAIDLALAATPTPEPLKTWITDKRVRGRSWDPASDRLQDLWEALTADKITAADGWSEYKRGTDARHAFVHRGNPPSPAEAEAFIVATHVLHVVESTSAT
jgi:hypothetical protein